MSGKKKPEALDKGIKNVIENIMPAVGVVAFFFLMVLGAFDVIGRYIFNRPIIGAWELSQLLVVVIIFFSWGYIQATRANIRIGIVVDRLPQRVRERLDLFSSILFLAIFSLLVWQLVVVGIENWRAGVMFETSLVSLPQASFQFLASFGALTVCLVLIMQIAELIRQIKGSIK